MIGGGRGSRTGTPCLKPHERCNPGAYVTERDFRGWQTGLVQAHEGELRQWARRDELGVTALAIAAVLLVFRGLRGGRDGCGVQMTLEGWAELLGRSRRMVAYAFAQLEAAGWVWRRRRFARVHWVDSKGRVRERADVWGVAYLSTLGAVRLARRGETRRLVARRGAAARVLVAQGAVGNLLKTYSAEIRAIANRVTDARERCTPSLRSTTRQKKTENDCARGRASHFSDATGPPLDAVGLLAQKGSRALEGKGSRFNAELDRLLSTRALTAALAWPEPWFNADDVGRRWLERQFERYRPELTRRFVAAAGPDQVLELQQEIDIAVRELGELERRQLTQKKRAITKYDARVRHFRAAVERLGNEQGRRR